MIPGDNTIWAYAPYWNRDFIRSAIQRAYKAINYGSMGGRQPALKNPTATVFQNQCDADWALWELLIALKIAGYDIQPNYNPDPGGAL